MGKCSVQDVIDRVVENIGVLKTESDIYKVLDKNSLIEYISMELQRRNNTTLQKTISDLQSKLVPATDNVKPEPEPEEKTNTKDTEVPTTPVDGDGAKVTKPKSSDTINKDDEAYTGLFSWLISKVGDKIGDFSSLPPHISLIDIVISNQYGTSYMHGVHNVKNNKSEIAVLDRYKVEQLANGLTSANIVKYIRTYQTSLSTTRELFTKSIKNYKKIVATEKDKSVREKYKWYIELTERHISELDEKQKNVTDLVKQLSANAVSVDDIKNSVMATLEYTHSPEYIKGTVMHELAHAAFSKYINDNPDSSYVHRLQTLFEEAKNAIPEGSIEGVSEYWRTDVHEFISELMGQPKLLEKLSTINASGKKSTSLLEAIKNVLHGILSQVFTTKNVNSISAEVLYILDNIPVNDNKTAVPADVENSIKTFIQKYINEGC